MKLLQNKNMYKRGLHKANLTIGYLSYEMLGITNIARQIHKNSLVGKQKKLEVTFLDATLELSFALIDSRYLTTIHQNEIMSP